MLLSAKIHKNYKGKFLFMLGEWEESDASTNLGYALQQCG